MNNTTYGVGEDWVSLVRAGLRALPQSDIYLRSRSFRLIEAGVPRFIDLTDPVRYIRRSHAIVDCSHRMNGDLLDCRGIAKLTQQSLHDPHLGETGGLELQLSGVVGGDLRAGQRKELGPLIWSKPQDVGDPRQRRERQASPARLKTRVPSVAHAGEFGHFLASQPGNTADAVPRDRNRTWVDLRPSSA